MVDSRAVIMGEKMEGDAEIEAWNSEKVGNTGEALVRVFITRLKPFTLVSNSSSIGDNCSQDTLLSVSSSVSPGNGFGCIPLNK